MYGHFILAWRKAQSVILLIKESQLIQPPINMARFLWPIGDWINWVHCIRLVQALRPIGTLTRSTQFFTRHSLWARPRYFIILCFVITVCWQTHLKISPSLWIWSSLFTSAGRPSLAHDPSATWQEKCQRARSSKNAGFRWGEFSKL